MGCFGGGANTDTGASKTQAQVTREQWADFQKRYIPVENELMSNTRSGTSLLSGAENDTTPDLAREMSAWSYDTPEVYSGKEKWKTKAAAREAKLAGLDPNSKQYAKGSRKLEGLKTRIAEATVPGSHFDGTTENTLAGQLQRADEINASSFEAGMGNTLRSAARYGGMTPEQKAEAERLNTLGASKSRMTARNTLRDATRDSDLALTGAMTGIGRGVAQNAQSGFNTSATLEASRNQANQANALSQGNSNLTALGSGAGLLALAFA